jgi:hypothetical protein
MPRAVLCLLLACAAAGAELPQRSAGPYRVTLRLPEGGLYAQEEMQLEFRVEDTTRPDPVTGFTAVVRAAPETSIDMPAMPAMPKFTEVAHPEGVPGDYGIHPTFAHGGDFRLRIAIHPPGAGAFSVEFPLVVSDAAQGARHKPPPPRFRLELSAEPKKPKAGQPVALSLVVRDRDTGSVREFDRMHERLLHLVMVRRDLQHFRHEHPAMDADGTFRLSYTFPAGGDYRLFADVAPKGAGGQILSAHLSVAGSNVTAEEAAPADTTVDVVSPTGALPVRKTAPIEFRVRDARSGERPVDLEPYLGVAGHLMLLHEDAATFVHCHPGDDGALRFLARFPKPGIYRGWLQVQRAGTVRTFAFTFHAEETP